MTVVAVSAEEIVVAAKAIDGPVLLGVSAWCVECVRVIGAKPRVGRHAVKLLRIKGWIDHDWFREMVDRRLNSQMRRAASYSVQASPGLSVLGYDPAVHSSIHRQVNRSSCRLSLSSRPHIFHSTFFNSVGTERAQVLTMHVNEPFRYLDKHAISKKWKGKIRVCPIPSVRKFANDRMTSPLGRRSRLHAR